MPLSLLRKAVKRKFTDDLAETPLMFDSNLDFWEFLYKDRTSKEGIVEDWHISYGFYFTNILLVGNILKKRSSSSMKRHAFRTQLFRKKKD